MRVNGHRRRAQLSVSGRQCELNGAAGLCARAHNKLEARGVGPGRERAVEATGEAVVSEDARPKESEPGNDNLRFRGCGASTAASCGSSSPLATSSAMYAPGQLFTTALAKKQIHGEQLGRTWLGLGLGLGQLSPVR